MKRIILVLVLLLAAQSYGVYGASKARKLTVDCEIEVGILCFDWQPNALGRLVGEDGDELEDRIEKAEKAWVRKVKERLEGTEEGDWSRVMDTVNEGLDRVRKAAESLGNDN